MGCRFSILNGFSCNHTKVSPDSSSPPNTTAVSPNIPPESSPPSEQNPPEEEAMVAATFPFTSPESRPRTGWSSLGPQMDLRPPSNSSNSSFTRVFSKRHPNGRQFTIDTSRAKSNRPAVSQCARKIGMRENTESDLNGEPCDVNWNSHWFSDTRNVIKSPHTRINKFPGMTELAKKISLTHAIGSMQRLFPAEYGFYPKSWFLPAHFDEFQKYCKEEKDKGRGEELWFIVKPDEGAQGTGIYLVRDHSEIVNPQQKQLVQEYVVDPFLMGDGLKFDFRVYGVIKSINPLSLYVAREGMARFCTEKYSKPTSSNMDNLFAHLTNYSLNKANGGYVHSHSLQDQIRGSKRLLSTVFHQLSAKGMKTKKLWHDIKLILVKTVLAIIPEIMLHYEHYFYDMGGPQCFQILGFDIMVKADGTPMLLEVNAAPSLSIDHAVPIPGVPFSEGEQRVRSIVDEVIKIPLVKDTLLLVLDLLDDEYIDRRSAASDVFRDDMRQLPNKKRPHLSEIFPSRYGSHSGHLLFLDKAMYIFMHFVQLQRSVTISTNGLKLFVRKCNLVDCIDQQELDNVSENISYGFTADRNALSNGLPFHAFLQLLFHIAEIKFPREPLLLSKMQRLLAYCDSSLRHYGVQSARLRRAEVDGRNLNSAVSLYMLPGRMKRRSKSSEPGLRKKGYHDNRRDRNNNRNTLTLPKIN